LKSRSSTYSRYSGDDATAMLLTDGYEAILADVVGRLTDETLVYN